MDAYEDILHLPYPIELRHPRMSRANRAAQFAPFSALTGYDAVVSESARLTVPRIELDEDEKAVLDRKLQLLRHRLPDAPKVSLRYFVPDERKEGGSYEICSGSVVKFDSYPARLVFSTGACVPISEILCLELEEERP